MFLRGVMSAVVRAFRQSPPKSNHGGVIAKQRPPAKHTGEYILLGWGAASGTNDEAVWMPECSTKPERFWLIMLRRPMFRNYALLQLPGEDTFWIVDVYALLDVIPESNRPATSAMISIPHSRLYRCLESTALVFHDKSAAKTALVMMGSR